MQTLAILKPDAIGLNLTGKILSHLEDAGFHEPAVQPNIPRQLKLQTIEQ
jgi:nucleoside diphosphate kinase